VRPTWRDTTPGPNSPKLNFSHRCPIRVLHMFLSVRRRTDYVRVQVRPVPAAPQHKYTDPSHVLREEELRAGIMRKC